MRKTIVQDQPARNSLIRDYLLPFCITAYTGDHRILIPRANVFLVAHTRDIWVAECFLLFDVVKKLCALSKASETQPRCTAQIFNVITLLDK